MSNFTNMNLNFPSVFFDQNINTLLNIYGRVMLLKLYVDDENDLELKNMYINASHKHNKKIFNNPQFIDAGFDLFAPGQKDCETIRFYCPDKENREKRDYVNKLDLNVCCSARMLTDRNKCFNTGFYMYPRSSISKTHLRLANSTGIIDAGYRGHLMGMFDVVNIPKDVDDDREADYYGKKFDRYLQICAPGLVPIIVEVVNQKEDLGEETERGNGGFGSTGR